MRINKNVLNYIKALPGIFMVTYVPVLFFVSETKLVVFESIICFIFCMIMLVMSLISAFTSNNSKSTNIFEIYKSSKIYLKSII